MKSKRIIVFSIAFALLFLLIGLNTASASSNDDVINNLSDSLESISNVDLASDSLESSQDYIGSGISDNIENDFLSDNNGILSNADDSSEDIQKENADSKSNLGSGNTVHTITENDYSNYFDSDGNLINSLVKANDTINLSGNFSNKKFIINIPLTITSTENNAFLKNSPIYYVNVSN